MKTNPIGFILALFIGLIFLGYVAGWVMTAWSSAMTQPQSPYTAAEAMREAAAQVALERTASKGDFDPYWRGYANCADAIAAAIRALPLPAAPSESAGEGQDDGRLDLAHATPDALRAMVGVYRRAYKADVEKADHAGFERGVREARRVAAERWSKAESLDAISELLAAHMGPK